MASVQTLSTGYIDSCRSTVGVTESAGLGTFPIKYGCLGHAAPHSHTVEQISGLQLLHPSVVASLRLFTCGLCTSIVAHISGLMPYMWFPPTFLALPLEIRHNIYSYLLIDRGVPHLINTNMFRDQETRMMTRSMFLTCRKIYQEAFNYYYAKNTFLLSLITPHYGLREIVAKSDFLQKRLQHLQSLVLVMETSEEQRRWPGTAYSFPYNFKYPKQQQQWTAFVKLLLDSKGEQGGRILKDLTIEDWGLKQPLSETTLERVEKETTVYSLLLQPLRTRISRIEVVKGPQKV